MQMPHNKKMTIALLVAVALFIAIYVTYAAVFDSSVLVPNRRPENDTSLNRWVMGVSLSAVAVLCLCAAWKQSRK